MIVFSKSTLRSFWERPDGRGSEGPLTAWHDVVSAKTESWSCWADLKEKFPRADLVGSCVVFDIGGNKWQLIVRVNYERQTVFVRKVMSHSEYDQNKWPDECDCIE